MATLVELAASAGAGLLLARLLFGGHALIHHIFLLGRSYDRIVRATTLAATCGKDGYDQESGS